MKKRYISFPYLSPPGQHHLRLVPSPKLLMMLFCCFLVIIPILFVFNSKAIKSYVLRVVQDYLFQWIKGVQNLNMHHVNQAITNY